MQKQLFLLLLFSCSAVRCGAVRCEECHRRCKPFLISGQSTSVQRLPTVSVTAGAPLTKVARGWPPGPASRNGTRQSIPVAWGPDMQSSLLSPYSVLSCLTSTIRAARPHTGTAQQRRLAPNEEFCRKSPDASNPISFPSFPPAASLDPRSSTPVPSSPA